jgi:HTH-type transcriptional regulator/antitoxin HigA
VEINPIRTEKDYRAALRVVSILVNQDPSTDTTEGACLDVLSTLIEAYERKHHPIDMQTQWKPSSSAWNKGMTPWFLEYKCGSTQERL